MTRRIGLVLSGWAPSMTLMSGAMLGFIDKGIEFEVVSTTGVGALVALLALAPKNPDPVEALKELPNLFVSDLLYSVMPINFKLFHKSGPFSRPMAELRERLPRLPVAPRDRDPLRRLLNDWVDLAFCAMTPSTFELKSAGLMSPGPEVERLVDFAKLPAANARFYVNAFNISKKTLDIFDKDHTDIDVYNAAQALPVLFAPQRMRNGDLLTTGASHDPTGLQAIWLKERAALDMVIMLDPVGAAIWREPVNIHDAFQLMLLNPIVTLQSIIAALYARADHLASRLASDRAQLKLPALYQMPITIDPKYFPKMLNWTHSNAVALEKIGYDSAVAFADAMKDFDKFDVTYRHYRNVEKNSRLGQFSRVLNPMFERIIEGDPADAGAKGG